MKYWPSSIKVVRCRLQLSLAGFYKSYSTSTPIESVSVQCQSHGSITLDVHHGAHGTHGTTARNIFPSILIYLPLGPLTQATESDDANIALLRSHLSCPIVRINYRLSEQHKYPTPVHDMLCGYDWIVENLLLKRGITRAGRAESVGRMAVFGEYIGGGLATALALTECRAGQPGIVAAAISNPMVDWVTIDQTSRPKVGARTFKTSNLKESTMETKLESLREIRARIFRKPEDYFDPFASPILFFRSAGAAVPPPPPAVPVDDLEQLSLLQREEHYQQPSDRTDSQLETKSNSDDQRNPTLRKASRRFPSKALGLRLPQFNISTSNASPLRDQAVELTHVLRQSFIRQSKYATLGHSEFGRKVLIDDEINDLDADQRALADEQAEEAKAKVELHLHDKPDGWSDDDDGQARLREAAVWLRSKLE